MDIRGKGKTAFDRDLSNRMVEAAMSSPSGKISKAKMTDILKDTAHEFKDAFDGERSSRGMTGMANAIKRTINLFTKTDWMTAGAKDAVKDFLSPGGGLKHAMQDIKDEVAYCRRQYSPPPRRTSYTT